MEPENKKNTGESTQITFKLVNDERQRIEEDAAKFSVSISEYCRIKCLLDEDETFSAKTKIIELEKLVMTLRVKLSYFKATERNPNDIVLKLTSAQRKILENLFSDYYTDFILGKLTIGENIIKALICFTTFKPIFDMFIQKGITIEEIQDAFADPEEEKEEEED